MTLTGHELDENICKLKSCSNVWKSNNFAVKDVMNKVAHVIGAFMVNYATNKVTHVFGPFMVD